MLKNDDNIMQRQNKKSGKIRSDRFDNNWLSAFPLGNGRIGAMVYGNPHRETIEINEESLWSGEIFTDYEDKSEYEGYKKHLILTMPFVKSHT